MPSHLEIIAHHALVRQTIRHAKVDTATMFALAIGFGIGGGFIGNVPAVVAAVACLFYGLYCSVRLALAIRHEREIGRIARQSIDTLNRISTGVWTV